MLAENREGIQSKLAPYLQFILGRFVAYMAFGLLAGWMGSLLNGKIPAPLIGFSFLGLGILLILYGLNAGFPNIHLCRIISPLLNKIKTPFLFGIFMGFNLCPPFLAAFADVFVAGRIAYGLVFFMVFFIVTSLFLLPFVLLGYLARFPSLRLVAQFAALITGTLYFFLGLIKLLSKQ